MAYVNPHSAYMDQKIAALHRSTRWATKIVDTTHAEFIRDFSSNVFTNFVRETFSATYLKDHPCSDCKKPSKERCHGVGEERPILIQRALERVYPDMSVPVSIKDILIAFLEEHKTTKFTFKCTECHKKEGINQIHDC